jgi:hypothetical protein
MKYLPALLTPFLAALRENSHLLDTDRSPISTTSPNVNSSFSHCSELLVVAKKVSCFAINCKLFRQNTRGGGVRSSANLRVLCASALSFCTGCIGASFQELTSCSPAPIDFHPVHFHALMKCFFASSFFSYSCKLPGVADPLITANGMTRRSGG